MKLALAVLFACASMASAQSRFFRVNDDGFTVTCPMRRNNMTLRTSGSLDMWLSTNGPIFHIGTDGIKLIRYNGTSMLSGLNGTDLTLITETIGQVARVVSNVFGGLTRIGQGFDFGFGNGRESFGFGGSSNGDYGFGLDGRGIGRGIGRNVIDDNSGFDFGSGRGMFGFGERDEGRPRPAPRPQGPRRGPEEGFGQFGRRTGPPPPPPPPPARASGPLGGLGFGFNF